MEEVLPIAEKPQTRPLDILKHFIFDNVEYQVDIIQEDGKSLFKASNIGDIIGIKHVQSVVRDFDRDELRKCLILTNGVSREHLVLTERGVFRLLTRSRKPIARPFQKWVISVIDEINATGKYKVESIEKELIKAHALVAKADKEKLEIIEKSKEDIATITVSAKHESLLDANDRKYVVYFARFKYLDNSYLKIGRTKNLKKRAAKHQEVLQEFSLFHVIECGTNQQFEDFLLHHEFIRKFKSEGPINDRGKKSHESFLMDEASIEKTVEIAKRNLHKFRAEPASVQTIFPILQEIKDGLNDMKKNQEGTQEKLDLLSVKVGIKMPPKAVAAASTIKEREISQGPKVQRYSTDGKTLLKTYKSVIDVVRDTSIERTSQAQIRLAIKDALLYKGFRWAALGRDKPDNTIQTLSDTAEGQRSIRKGYVAMLDLDRKGIVKVYSELKDAAVDRKLKGVTAISNAMTRKSQCRGHYFEMWDTCSKEMQNAYLEKNILPVPKLATNGKQVVKIDMIGNEEMFPSIQHVQNKLQVGRKTVMDAIKFNYELKGCKWKYYEVK